ncbi:MAG: hypothetical protein EXR98_16350 [Gemmataceae bacterium]|nr:hypothetical protein [Gemmataceae bacterium]
METTYIICALIGGTLITCQFLMTLFGLGGHHDMAGGDHVDVAGHGGGADHHGGHGDNSTWFLGMLTFRTVSAGLAFFGLVGLIGIRGQWDGDGDKPVTILAAIAAGVGALFFVGWIMKLLARLNMDGTVRIGRAVGCIGTVYLPIPGANAGAGKVHLSLMGRTMEYQAVTARDALAVGAKVVVVAVIGSDAVEVAPAQE